MHTGLSGVLLSLKSWGALCAFISHPAVQDSITSCQREQDVLRTDNSTGSAIAAFAHRLNTWRATMDVRSSKNLQLSCFPWTREAFLKDIFSYVFVVIMQAVVKQVFLRKTVIQAINNDLRQIVSEHKWIKWWRNSFLYHFPKHTKQLKMEHNWFQVTMRLNIFINDTKKKTRTNDINTQWENKETVMTDDSI